MEVFVGLDVGSVSAKLAAICTPQTSAAELCLRDNSAFFPANPELERIVGAAVLLSAYRRTFGNPVQTTIDLLEVLFACFPSRPKIAGLRVTGSGARLIAESRGANTENEFKAIACALGRLYPQVRTVFEIGGESSKYLRLASLNRDQATGSNGNTYANGIADYSTSGECAAGTGSFLDQQATRLQCGVEEIGEVVSEAKCAARIAGRCSVFAKSDMIHAQQKGYSTEEVLKGLCEAVARNFKSNIVRGKPVNAPVALIGAVSQNRGVVQALAEGFRLGAGELFVPQEYAWM
jgi:activator of 2-hydroxyglutaryl-CoA dehydratase